MRRTSNRYLSPLPSEEEIVEAIVKISESEERRMKDLRARGFARYFYGVSAQQIASHFNVEPARRMGNGAVKGSWSGYMPAAMRVAPRLRGMAIRGLIKKAYNPDDRYRNYYVAN